MFETSTRRSFDDPTPGPQVRAAQDDDDANDDGEECGADRETRLIAQLRKEANREKDDFAWHTFQALSISSIALGGIFYFMFTPGGFPAVGLGAVLILAFVLVTCRLGDSCYTSANRHYGYELFLYRVRNMPDGKDGRWRQSNRTIEWEAAMRAWRVVQASLFEAIYLPGNYLWFDRRKSAFRRWPRPFTKRANPFWFCQSSLSRDSGAKFHAGNYLSRMHAMLLLVALASVSILYAAAMAVPFRPILLDTGQGPLTGLAAQFSPDGADRAATADCLNRVLFLLCILACGAATYVLAVRFVAERAKRRIMEDELLSIHACSIVWQAVVVAHFAAVRRAAACGLSSRKLVELARKARCRHRAEWKDWSKGDAPFEDVLAQFSPEEKGARDGGSGIVGYTFWLAEEAASLARCAIDVPGWIGVGEAELRRRGIVR
ncbi:MAG TPA: hypothetical protein VGB91_15930 [Rhizomicrobium sp.]